MKVNYASILDHDCVCLDYARSGSCVRIADGSGTLASSRQLAKADRNSPPHQGSGLPPGFDTKIAFDGAFAEPQAFNKRVKLLWLGAGTEEAQFRTGIKGAAEALREAGVKVTYFESQGTAHEWQTWRRDLHEFAPLLFQ